jgi:hypothetical protein
MKNYLKLIHDLAMPQLHKDLIVGTLLGDCSIKKNSTKNIIFKYDQGLPNKDYLYYHFKLQFSFY